MSKEDKFEYLGAIRGIAAFTVFLAHVIQIYWLRLLGLGSWPHVISSEASYYSVVVFFMLSGFLITHSVEANVARRGILNLPEFVAARLARLYPPFLFAIFISVIVYGFLELFALPGRTTPMTLPGDVYAAREMVHFPLTELLTALILRDGLLEINGPLWSLYMEAKLYVLFACTYVLWQGRRPYFLLAVLAIVLYYTLRAGWRYNPEFLRYAAIWLVGSCAYYLRMPERQTLQRRSFACSASLVVLIVAIDLIAPYLGISPLRGAGRPIWIDVVIAAGFSWFLFGLRLRLSFGRRMADYSYSLYATHFPVLLFFQALLVANGNTSLIGAAVASACGGVVAIALARVGGRLEAAKPIFQQQLLSLWQIVFERSIAILPNRPR
jgi:peptidoglycan/LPS O-acetylase OafA/YrhL